ncbi:MAG: peptidylprolyl isomerase [Phenylobacterium sp.]|jgi:peptidylprolyl isomerase
MSKIIILVIIVAIVAMLIIRSSGNSKTAAVNIQEGEAFLAKNAQVEGVESLPSGLQYQVLTKGTGAEHPKASDKVKVHYHGTQLDGSVFDSSVERGSPTSFGLNQVIPGWTEGVQLMVVGEKTRFFIPANLAYGNRATGKIGAGSTLIFDVELLAINP